MDNTRAILELLWLLSAQRFVRAAYIIRVVTEQSKAKPNRTTD